MSRKFGIFESISSTCTSQKSTTSILFSIQWFFFFECFAVLSVMLRLCGNKNSHETLLQTIMSGTTILSLSLALEVLLHLKIFLWIGLLKLEVKLIQWTTDFLLLNFNDSFCLYFQCLWTFSFHSPRSQLLTSQFIQMALFFLTYGRKYNRWFAVFCLFLYVNDE